MSQRTESLSAKKDRIRISIKKQQNEEFFKSHRQRQKSVFLIFPVSLYKNVELLKGFDRIILVEDKQYFKSYNFHKLKLVYHRATMKSYENYLKGHFPEKSISYVSVTEKESCLLDLLKDAAKCGFYDPIDKPVTTRYLNLLQNLEVTVEILENQSFLCTRQDLEEFKKQHVKQKDGKPNYQHDSQFYRWQRRRLNILMGKNGSDPKQWTYDSENRQPYKQEVPVPRKPEVIKDHFYEEACKYIEANFTGNFGQSTETIYPIDHSSSEAWLEGFLQQKLQNFGPFQDAVQSDYPFMFHSVLSPMMNIGLLSSKLIVDKTLEIYYRNNSPIQSVEGFIRQVIGWREYVRLLYHFESERQMNANFFNHSNLLSENWYAGTTKLPHIDHMIQKVKKYAYLHHIERLMYVGNTMLLAQLHPKEVFRWFMEVHIDSYEWVMAPNVFGMTQHADGGMMMTRPYICSSNYIVKMSNFGKVKEVSKIGGTAYEWKEVFDAMYYNFIGCNEEALRSYYATSRQVAHWVKKDASEQDRLMKLANAFIRQYLVKRL